MRLADLAVSLGANVQPGQVVTVAADHGQYEIARAVAEAAYKRGAKFVDVQYFDPYVKHARIAFAADDTLEFVPSWFSYRMLAVGEERAARISLTGPTTTGLLDDLDPERAGRDQLPFTKEILKVIGDRTTNWTVVPCPTEPWARLVFPDLPPDEAFDRLWEQVAHVCRLDEPDPVAMWNERADALTAAAGRLNERGFDSLVVAEHSHVPASRVTPYPAGGDLPREYYRVYDPIVTVTAAAVATSELRIGTGVLLLAQRDTIQTAKEIASTDHIARGRLQLGLGLGWNLEEIADHGIDPATRGKLLDEKLSAMKERWTKEKAEFHG